ncbi:hypothetical protein BDR26DRAFT_863572 [Obelidium mucronatum]|nr:hypothetical protein BDR26DRAFT_863572 [Obelidium mucronatum]
MEIAISNLSNHFLLPFLGFLALFCQSLYRSHTCRLSFELWFSWQGQCLFMKPSTQHLSPYSVVCDPSFSSAISVVILYHNWLWCSLGICRPCCVTGQHEEPPKKAIHLNQGTCHSTQLHNERATH